MSRSIGDNIFKGFVAWMAFVAVLSIVSTTALITAGYLVGKHFGIW